MVMPAKEYPLYLPQFHFFYSLLLKETFVEFDDIPMKKNVQLSRGHHVL